MNGYWGGGTRVSPPASACSPQQQKMCEEARAAAAWLWLQSEVAGAFERFSKDLLALHSRGLTAATALDVGRSSDVGNGGGTGGGGGGSARDALNSLLLLCSEAGAEAERFSSSLRAGVVKPINEVLEPLARAADATESVDATNSVCPVAVAGGGEVQKAAKRLQLAEEELTKAEASLHELRSLFGSDINSSLEKKATQRISRASRLKVAAQEALQQAVAAEAAKGPQGSSTSSAPSQLSSLELRGSARLLRARNGAGWAEAGGVRAEQYHRRVATAVLQSMKAAGKAALTSQQRSTGYVLHYIRDLQLFAAAEEATAGASGAYSGDDEHAMLPPGAAEDLMSKLYRPNTAAADASKQQTNEATLRNLLKHQEKQLQDVLTERDELRRQTEKQQGQISELQSQLIKASPREAWRKPRKQVTICLSESEDENTPFRQQQYQSQGGERGELHGRAERKYSKDTALQLSAITAGNAVRAHTGTSDASPPAAGSREARPIEMAWVDVQLRYEAFLLTLRSLPLSNMTARTTNATPTRNEQQQEEHLQRSWGTVEEASLSSSSLSASHSENRVREMHWMDPSFAAELAEAVESAADAALPSFLVRCCRLAAAAASPCTEANQTQRSKGSSRMSVQQVQGRMLMSKRQQQKQQQEEASGRPLGPLDWTESDMQVLAYELILLAAYHHSQYAAASALLADEEEILNSSNTPWVQEFPPEVHPQQQQLPDSTSRPHRLRHKTMARAMSFKLRGTPGDQPTHQQHQAETGGDAGVEPSAGDGPSTTELLAPFHPFSLPLEEWQRRLAGKGPSKGPYSSVLPARVRLQVAQKWMTPSPLLQQSNEDVLLQLLQLARVSFELPSASSNKLLHLLTPLADSGFAPGGGVPAFLHPCDLRFRVCRLMEAWRVALCPAAGPSKALPHKQQQPQQQQQRAVRFKPGATANVILDATQGVRGAIRRRAGGQTASTEKRGTSEGRRVSSAVGEAQSLNPGGTGQTQQQLAGDLGPPKLLQATPQTSRSKRLGSVSHAMPASASEVPVRRQDPVFQSFVQRQLQLLHAAALSRCARLLKFLLPQGGSTSACGRAGDPQGEGRGTSHWGDTVSSALPWRPVQLQQLYARERSRSDEEAFLFFLRSLLLCQDGAADPKAAPQAPAFLLYSKEETAAAIAAAAQLQLLPLRLLCCFYHIFAYVFALQQLQRQQLWGDEEASVRIEEVSISVTHFSGAPAGTGEAEAPLTWEVRTEQRERAGVELLQLLLHNMSQAATLDSALRCSLAARSSSNPTLKHLAADRRSEGNGAVERQQSLRKQHSLRPFSNLLEVPASRLEASDNCSGVSDGGLVSGSEIDGPERVSGSSAHHGEGGHLPAAGLRSHFHRPTLKGFKRRTMRTLETGAAAARAAVAASMLDADAQQPLYLPREVQLSAYWCMDVPLLMSLLLLLGRCCADATSTNGLQIDAPLLVQGLLLVAHAAQIGTDPTCPTAEGGSSGSETSSAFMLVNAARAGSGFPGISLESVALLVAASVWAAGSTLVSTEQQQRQQQQSSVQGSGSGEAADFSLQAQGSRNSALLATTNKQDTNMPMQRLLQQLLTAAPSVVQPTRAEVVSSALELLTDFSGFIKKPSADADAASDEVGWLFGGPQAGDDQTREPHTAAVGSPRATGTAREDGGLAGAAGELAAPQRAPARMLQRQASSVAAALLHSTTTKRKAPQRAATADMEGLSVMDHIQRVRGERLEVCMRPFLVQQQEGAVDEGREVGGQQIATFSGFITSRLWLGTDWWVTSKGPGGINNQCALRSSRSAVFCYGLSALLPSRVELQQQEIASVQLLGCNFLMQLQQQLQDYRRYFEPQVLPLAISAWQGLLQRLLLLPQGQQKSVTPHGASALWIVCTEIPEGWNRRTLEALQCQIDPRKGGDDGGQQQDRHAREEDGDCGSSWVWSLPGILRGPSLLHDMLRCFIHRSFAAAAGRFLGFHVSALLRASEEDTAMSTRNSKKECSSGDEAPDKAADDPFGRGGQTQAEEDAMLCALAEGIEALRGHVQSELLLYSDVFAHLLPLPGEHSLMILTAAQAVLLSLVPLVLRCAEKATEDPEKGGLPAIGGRAVLHALAGFERLTDELSLGEVLCVSLPTETQQQQRGLVSALAPSFFASFSLHLSGLTDLLSQAFLTDVFAPAQPPQALYSEKAIDGWCCIYGVVDAALDSCLPLDWLLPRLLQFLSELVASLCRSLTDPCMSHSEGPGTWGGRPLLPLLALRQLQQKYFEGLLDARGQKAAIAESPLVEHFLSLQRSAEERSKKQSRKSKGWRNRVTQLVGGWEEEGKDPVNDVSRLGSAFLSGIEDNTSDDNSNANEGPASVSRGGVGIPAGDHDRTKPRSVLRRFFGSTTSRESSLAGAAVGRHEAEGQALPKGTLGASRHVVMGMDRLSEPVSLLLGAVDTLQDWEAAREKAAHTGGQRPTTGMQRWLVRLHIVSLYLQRLPGLRTKVLQETEKRVVCRCPRDVELVEHLRKLQGKAGRRATDTVQIRQENELAEFTAMVNDSIDGLSQKLQETAKELCSLAALHLVYYELQGDIFGNLYAGEEGINGMTLARLLDAFPNTVEAFFCAAPLEWQDDVASAVISCLAKAWCLLLAEWGYGGHFFEAKEVEVLEGDLDSLRQYTTDNEISIESADGGGIFDRVNDFLVMLDADGRCLASASYLEEQQASPRGDAPADQTTKNCKSIGAPGRAGQTPASIFASVEAAPPGGTPSTRRRRHRGREGSNVNETGTGKRRHSKVKGWAGVGRWVRGVYGHSHNRETSRASHTSNSADITSVDRGTSREKSLRFVV